VRVVRIIPCLDIREGRIVKGINFENLVDVGDPAEAAAAYCRQGADEIVFLDIFATLQNRKTSVDWVRRVVERSTVPIAVGGGVSGADDAGELLGLGISKVSLNTAAVRTPQLVKDISKRFGREKTVVAIDGRKNAHSGNNPEFEVLINSGREATGIGVVEWAREAESLGAGEILLTSKDADGTGEGYDLEMTRAVAEVVEIPVIASGGARELDHLYQAVVSGKAAAVLVASAFHFGGMTIAEAKRYLKEKGIPVAA
jgi:cyclase